MVTKAIKCTVLLCRLAISLSNVEYLNDKCFSQFVLRIVPLKCWAAVAMYIPLQILFQCLDEHLDLRKVWHMCTIVKSV